MNQPSTSRQLSKGEVPRPVRLLLGAESTPAAKVQSRYPPDHGGVAKRPYGEVVASTLTMMPAV